MTGGLKAEAARVFAAPITFEELLQALGCKHELDVASEIRYAEQDAANYEAFARRMETK